MVGQLCTKHKYTQISKGNWEWGNWATTRAVKLGKWLKNCYSTANCVLSTGTQKYLKATWNRETGQPPALSNRVGGIGNRCRTTNCILSTGTWKYLKAIGKGETSQPPVQSNRASDWGNEYRTHVYRVQVHAYFKRQLGRGNWPITCAVKSGKWLGKSLS